MLMAYQMINVYQLYIIQNYIGQSVKESAVTVSVVSMIMMVMSLVGSFISGPVSDLIGRRKVPVVVASVLFAVGIAMPWIFKSTMGMYLFAGIAGLATPSTPPSTRRCWWTCCRTRKRPARIWAS